MMRGAVVCPRGDGAVVCPRGDGARAPAFLRAGADCGREQIVGGGADGSAVEGFSVSLRPGMLGFL